jgi:hypothetical protein
VTTNVTLWLVVALLTNALLGCGKRACQEQYAPGDRFNITVNGSLAGDTPCDIMPLHEGDSFTLIVGPIAETDQDGCPVSYLGQGLVPNYASGVMTSCLNSVEDPRTLSCCGMVHGCLVCQVSELSALPTGSDPIIEHATLTSVTSSHVEDWGALDAGICLPNNCAWDEYDVTIERVAIGANN